jgi:hypothetical protein
MIRRHNIWVVLAGVALLLLTAVSVVAIGATSGALSSPLAGWSASR